MSYGETITRNDLTDILNEVLPSGSFEIGSYSAIPSFPWTAPYDCVVQARVYPASTANSYISFNLNDGRAFNLTAVNGTALSGEILVKKGTVLSNYQYSNLAPNASYIGYIPIYHTMSGGIDYIVEQGTSGIWTYRKWNSGVAECWGNELKSTAVNTAWGNDYVSPALSTSFPSDFFTSAPIVSIYISGGYSATVQNANASPTKDSVVYGILRPVAVSTSQSYRAHIHATGTWK